MRHDFRAYYHVRYEDVDPDEALDLILTLPDGSRYAGSIDPSKQWTNQQYMLANILDYLSVINWRLANCTSEFEPQRTPRPADGMIRKREAERVARVKKTLQETDWEDI